tara:strand:- start:850 stop:1311 length:462 start_codon:yes stop_codon:yes gene_type:complete
VRAVVGIWFQRSDRLEIAPQFVGDHNVGLTVPSDQPLQKAPCCLIVSARLHQDTQHISICIDGPPQPVFHTTDRDDNFIQMPFIVGPRSISADAICEVSAETIDPKTYRFPTDVDTALGKQVLDIGCAQSEPVVCLNGIGDNLARVTQALEVR